MGVRANAEKRMRVQRLPALLQLVDNSHLPTAKKCVLTSHANTQGLLGRQPKGLTLLRRQRHKHVRRRRIRRQQVLGLLPLNRNVLYPTPARKWRWMRNIRAIQRVRSTIPKHNQSLTPPLQLETQHGSPSSRLSSTSQTKPPT